MRSAVFQFVHRKARIGRDEGPRLVDRLQHYFAAAAPAHAKAQNAQQLPRLGRIAVIDHDDPGFAGQFFEFPRLRKVAVHQLEVFGLFQRFVVVRGLKAVGHHVARHRRQHVSAAVFRARSPPCVRTSGSGRECWLWARGPGRARRPAGNSAPPRSYRRPEDPVTLGAGETALARAASPEFRSAIRSFP